MKILQELSNLVSELQSTTSTKLKVDIISTHCKGNDDLKKIIHYTYNPYYHFNLTSKNCIKNSGLVMYSRKDQTIFDVLDDLRTSNVTGHEAISMVNYFINKYGDYSELIYCIIDKDLKTRTGAKLINKAIPNLIPQFSVALAEKYETHVDLDGEVWLASRKLDGVRCLFIVNEDGDVEPFSRKGIPFKTLGRITEEIRSLNLYNVVFDGEICVVDENGNEDFQGVMTEIRRKNHTMEKPQYKVFDFLSMAEFNNTTYDYTDLQPLTARLGHLKHVLEDSDLDHLSILEQERVTSETFGDWHVKARDGGWEGFMIRKNVGYEGKRTKNLLKVKKFFDDEYVVKSIGTGQIRHIVDGVDIEQTMMTQVVIEHKGYEVEVGSGFSMAQRIKYHKDPQLIIGKTITVQYFEETNNQEGTVSLRFPTVKHIYENGRDC